MKESKSERNDQDGREKVLRTRWRNEGGSEQVREEEEKEEEVRSIKKRIKEVKYK